MTSTDERTSWGTRRGPEWFAQLMSPHRRSLTISDTLMEARTPMFTRYSRWIGETLRSTEELRSSGAPVSGRRAGTSRAGV